MGFRIGTKINFLILAVLTISVGSVIQLATQLFTGDFSTLLRKNSLDVASILAARMKDRVTHLSNHATLLASASFEEFRYDEDRLRFIQENLAREPFFVGLTLYGRDAGIVPVIKPLWRVSRKDGAAGALRAEEFAALEKNYPINLEATFRGTPQFGVAKLPAGGNLVRLSFPVVKSADGSFADIMVAELEPEILSSLLADSTGFSALLVNPDGTVLTSSDPVHWVAGDQIADLAAFRAFSGGQRAGEQVLRYRHPDPEIFAFHEVGFGGLGVMTVFPLASIENARRALYLRSALLGGALLFAAIAIALLFAKAITTPIRALSAAADRVAAGDLTARVPEPKRRDEVAVLSRTFNKMAGRISELLVETAEKVRMEEELETARTLQAMFTPDQGFQNETLNLAGGLISASECCGDWWQYSVIDRYVIVAMGDVTGHGVSSSLLTAVAQGVYSLFVTNLKKEGEIGFTRTPDDWLISLVQALNLAILGAGKKQRVMTFVASVIDTHTGVVTTVNQAHLAPFAYREGPLLSPHKVDQKRFHTLTRGVYPALGEAATIETQPFRFQLEPGDWLAWFTDGLVDQITLSEGRASRLRLYSLVANTVASHSESSQAMCGELLEKAFAMSPAGTHPEDDITFAVAQVPRSALFLPRLKGVAA